MEKDKFSGFSSLALVKASGCRGQLAVNPYNFLLGPHRTTKGLIV
jgi:hypothetical protein